MDDTAGQRLFLRLWVASKTGCKIALSEPEARLLRKAAIEGHDQGVAPETCAALLAVADEHIARCHANERKASNWRVGLISHSAPAVVSATGSREWELKRARKFCAMCEEGDCPVHDSHLRGI